MMDTFLVAVFALSSVATLVMSAIRLYLEWKRSKNTAWETAVRLMASDQDFRCRSDDFADLYSALKFLEKHPDCLSEYITLSQAIHANKRERSNKNAAAHCTEQSRISTNPISPDGVCVKNQRKSFSSRI